MELDRSAAARSESLSTRVVLEVAEREGVGPSELDQPLYDVINPDSLDALFAPTGNAAVRPGGQIEFTYCGYDVTVKNDGRVVVSTPENES